MDGLVCSPGQMARRPQGLPGSSGMPALLVRMDWSNTLRGAASPLPPHTPHRVPLLDARDALESGATAMVSTFLLGYDEELEARCLHDTVQWALTGKELGLPLVVEVVPSGPRVSLPGKAVELGASYALEGGADAIVVPFPGQASLKTIGAFLSVPWLLKPSDLAAAPAELAQALDAGAAGLWLDHAILAEPSPAGALRHLAAALDARPNAA